MHKYFVKRNLMFLFAHIFSVGFRGKHLLFCLTVGATLYRKLMTYLMTEEQLQEHGYPRTSPEAAGKAVIYNLPEKKTTSDREPPSSLLTCF